MTELRTRCSEATITGVLRPFLAGVFLDPSLGTSTRLFHLIWRCFLRGGAALPEDGMQMLPRLVALACQPAPCDRNAVSEVSDSGVRTGAGEHIEARAVIIATDGTAAAALAPALAPPGGIRSPRFTTGCRPHRWARRSWLSTAKANCC